MPSGTRARFFQPGNADMEGNAAENKKRFEEKMKLLS